MILFLACFAALFLLSVVAFRFINPPFTPLMVAGAPLISWILGTMAVFFLVYAWTDDS